MTPYEGKPILDIPADVLDHASAILEEAQALEEEVEQAHEGVRKVLHDVEQGGRNEIPVYSRAHGG